MYMIATYRINHVVGLYNYIHYTLYNQLGILISNTSSSDVIYNYTMTVFTYLRLRQVILIGAK